MSSQTFTLSLAGPEDLKEIAVFINKHFFLDIPLIRMFGIEEVPPVLQITDRPDEHVAFIMKAISSEGHLIGAAVVRSKDEDWPITENTDSKTVQYINFIHFVNKDARLHTLPERRVEISVLSVAPDCRRKGVGRSLGIACTQEAKQRGFDMVQVCCVNEFIANITRSVDFQEFYKLAYSEYCRTSGITMHRFPPHDYIYMYVKDLRE